MVISFQLVNPPQHIVIISHKITCFISKCLLSKHGKNCYSLTPVSHVYRRLTWILFFCIFVRNVSERHMQINLSMSVRNSNVSFNNLIQFFLRINYYLHKTNAYANIVIDVRYLRLTTKHKKQIPFEGFKIYNIDEPLSYPAQVTKNVNASNIHIKREQLRNA